MNLIEFVQDLSLKGVKLWSDEGKLRIGGFQEVLTTDIIAELKQYKSEILQLLRENPELFQATDKISTISGIQPVSHSEHLSLSYPQEWMYFWYEFPPNNRLFDVSVTLKIEGLLNIKVLEQSFNEIIRRHETLRSSFHSVDGKPVQVISTV
ncbi:condensation domain-containing protein, partial [Moorena sp. SIO3I8]|uniref:condensation domain-containing protein n=1 Tax=Moorena sp. SIO3I8 TaxID=2607833 RepID=UPI0013BF8E03